MNKSNEVSPVEACLAGVGGLALIATLPTWLTPTMTILGDTVATGSGHDGWTSGIAILVANLYMLGLLFRSGLASFGVVRHMSHWKTYSASSFGAFLLILIGVGTHSNVAGGPGLVLGCLVTLAASVLCIVAATGHGVGRKPVVQVVSATEDNPAA